MYSLILDSSNKDLNVGLAKNNEILEEISYECWQRQSELMIPEIDNILKKHHINPKEIDEVLVTVGPGSYTGVRIALTIAKVYSYALKIKCYIYSSLEVLQNVDNNSICLINARSNRSYFGVYNKETKIIEDKVLTNDEVKEYIKNNPSFSICGEVTYLNLEGEHHSIIKNMISLKNESRVVNNIMSLKAIYLKD